MQLQAQAGGGEELRGSLARETRRILSLFSWGPWPGHTTFGTLVPSSVK